MAQELSQLNHYFSQTCGTWTQLQTVDLLALGDDTTRNILKGVVQTQGTHRPLSRLR